LPAFPSFGASLFFNFASIARDIVNRPFVTVGFLVFVLMLPLAARSIDRTLQR
jgi:methionine sulfoxide reductase heme-binding subunit